MTELYNDCTVLDQNPPVPVDAPNFVRDVAAAQPAYNGLGLHASAPPHLGHYSNAGLTFFAPIAPASTTGASCNPSAIADSSAISTTSSITTSSAGLLGVGTVPTGSRLDFPCLAAMCNGSTRCFCATPSPVCDVTCVHDEQCPEHGADAPISLPLSLLNRPPSLGRTDDSFRLSPLPLSLPPTPSVLSVKNDGAPRVPSGVIPASVASAASAVAATAPLAAASATITAGPRTVSSAAGSTTSAITESLLLAAAHALGEVDADDGVIDDDGDELTSAEDLVQRSRQINARSNTTSTSGPPRSGPAGGGGVSSSSADSSTSNNDSLPPTASNNINNLSAASSSHVYCNSNTNNGGAGCAPPSGRRGITAATSGGDHLQQQQPKRKRPKMHELDKEQRERLRLSNRQAAQRHRERTRELSRYSQAQLDFLNARTRSLGHELEALVVEAQTLYRLICHQHQRPMETFMSGLTGAPPSSAASVMTPNALAAAAAAAAAATGSPFPAFVAGLPYASATHQPAQSPAAANLTTDLARFSAGVAFPYAAAAPPRASAPDSSAAGAHAPLPGFYPVGAAGGARGGSFLPVLGGGPTADAATMAALFRLGVAGDQALCMALARAQEIAAATAAVNAASASGVVTTTSTFPATTTINTTNRGDAAHATLASSTQ